VVQEVFGTILASEVQLMRPCLQVRTLQVVVQIYAKMHWLQLLAAALSDQNVTTVANAHHKQRRRDRLTFSNGLSVEVGFLRHLLSSCSLMASSCSFATVPRIAASSAYVRRLHRLCDDVGVTT
jgi:hypothetical protein